MKQSQKRILSILAAAALTVCAVPQNTPVSLRFPALTAIAAEEGDFEYSVSEDGTSVTITKWNGTEGAVEIPAKIEGKPVTEIGSWTFNSKTGITAVSIPASVTVIGSNSFSYCTGLTEIELPQNLKIIGSGAFSGTGLTAVTIPAHASIGNQAFSSCKSLEDIVIPSTVTDIGESAFRYTPWLTAMQQKNPLVIVNQILIDGTTASGEVTVPDDVTSICAMAFSGNRTITGVKVPASVKNIGGDAFSRCTALKSVTLTDGLEHIGFNAFTECSALTEIVIPDSVTEIEGSAFMLCEKLASVTLPKNLTVISNSLFSSCNSLKEITFPKSLIKIDVRAFANCFSLKEIVIPDGTAEIGYTAFMQCRSLESVTVPSSVTTLGVSAFSMCPNLTMYGPMDSAAEIYAANNDILYCLPGEAVAFSDVSLTLSDDLGLNFYAGITTATNPDQYKVIFTGKCTEEGEDVFLTEKQGKYCATASVSANHTDQKIIAALYQKDGSDWKKICVQSYSVNHYLSDVTPDESWTDAQKASFSKLRSTVSLYGSVSKAYFENPDSMPAVTAYTSELLAESAAGVPVYAPDFDNKQAKIALVLNAKLAARLYVMDLPAGAEATCGTKTLTAKKAADGRYYFEITGIKPTQLADKITVSYAGTNYTFAPLAWSYRVANRESTPERDAVMANILYAYYKDAAAFADAMN